MTIIAYPARTWMTNKREDWQPWAMQAAAEMWRAGKGTKAIADALGVDESECWNRLDKIKAYES